jgi:hypothetical protein
MQLCGKDLARQVPKEISGHDARRMYGALTASLHQAYAVLDAWNEGRALVGVVVHVAAIDAGAVQAARGYLDTTNDMLGAYYGHVIPTDEAIPEQQLVELRASVSTSSVAVRTIDDLFGTSYLAELVAEIVDACGTVSAKAAAAAAKVLGSTLGALWWVVVPAVAVVAMSWGRRG